MRISAAMQVTKRRGLLGKWLGAAFQSPLEREREFYRRLRVLGDRINEAPESFTHHVLRGELYLERGEYKRAQADFETALELTEALDDTKGWLVLEQVMRDRALFGIKAVERKLPALEENQHGASLEA